MRGTGGLSVDGRRPDVIVKFKNGTYALIEVQSKSQTKMELIDKVDDMLGQLGKRANQKDSAVYDLMGRLVR